MYFGIGNTVIPARVPAWFAGQRIAGTLVIALGGVMICWALLFFKSWRIRAALTADHQLATGGPFRFVRHPIYLGLDLLALGSAVWVPTPALWLSVILMVLGSDLRGRAEEKLLVTRFGEAYTSYMARTRRFLPGVY
jgi:protein-S-isoprenylcysteine O-methyltransferase Ste14